MQDVFVSAPLFWCGEIYKWVQLESQTQLLNFPLALLYCASRWRFIRGFYRDEIGKLIYHRTGLDGRWAGLFFRSFCQKEFEEHSLNLRIVQCNIFLSNKERHASWDAQSSSQTLEGNATVFIRCLSSITCIPGRISYTQCGW